jgi:hypothetical protein
LALGTQVWLALGLLLCTVAVAQAGGRDVPATYSPLQRDLLEAARRRYPGTEPKTQGMAFYGLVPFKGGYLAWMRDGSGGLFENNREGGALWHYQHGRWTLLSDRSWVAINDTNAWQSVGLSKQQRNKLISGVAEHTLRRTMCDDDSAPAGPVESLRAACLRRFPGAERPYVQYANVVPYGNTAFGMTIGSREGFYAPLWAVWERKGGQWSFIFDFEYWPYGFAHYGTYTAATKQRHEECLDRLFAQYRFSRNMRQQLFSGLFRQTAP